MLMKLANAVLFYTDHEVGEYRARLGRHDRRRVVGLNNGINIDPIIPLRAPYEANKRDKAIMFVGRLTEKTELEILLHSLADPRLDDVKLNIIGDGQQRDSLEALARSLAINDRITWHGGSTDEQTIARIANNCQIFAYPGAVGLSLLHAMAYGLPAVVHNDRWGHMPEIAAFYKAKSGLTFSRGDPQSLTITILKALRTVTQDQSWSEAAIRVSDRDFNTARMAERFRDLVLYLKTQKRC